jgi:hypothetical protein
MNKVATDYIVSSNRVMEEFLKHMGLEPDHENVREHWIGSDRLPWIAGVGDWFWSIDDMFLTLYHNIPADIVFEHYYMCCDTYAEDKQIKINLTSYASMRKTMTQEEIITKLSQK